MAAADLNDSDFVPSTFDPLNTDALSDETYLPTVESTNRIQSAQTAFPDTVDYIDPSILSFPPHPNQPKNTSNVDPSLFDFGTVATVGSNLPYYLGQEKLFNVMDHDPVQVNFQNTPLPSIVNDVPTVEQVGPLLDASYNPFPASTAPPSLCQSCHRQLVNENAPSVNNNIPNPLAEPLAAIMPSLDLISFENLQPLTQPNQQIDPLSFFETNPSFDSDDMNATSLVSASKNQQPLFDSGLLESITDMERPINYFGASADHIAAFLLSAVRPQILSANGRTITL